MRFYNTILFLLFSILFVGCTDNDENPVVESEPVVFSIPTRAGGTPPEENATFGFMAYRSDNQSFTRSGTYRYTSKVITLLPCTTDENGVPQDSINSNRSLQFTTDFYTIPLDVYMMTPGIMPTTADGAIWVRYKRNIPFRFSTNTFKLTYRNYKLYELGVDTLVMEDIKSHFTFSFIQGTNQSILVENFKIFNVGETALFNPETRSVVILDQGSEDYGGGKNWQDVTLDNKGNSTKGEVSFVSSDPVSIFPADYTSGNLRNIILEFTLSVGAGSTKVTIPVSVKTQSSIRYNFSVEVTSALIDITYTTQGWTTVYDNNSERIILGEEGDTCPLGTFILPPQWEDGNNDGSSTID